MNKYIYSGPTHISELLLSLLSNKHCSGALDSLWGVFCFFCFCLLHLPHSWVNPNELSLFDRLTSRASVQNRRTETHHFPRTSTSRTSSLHSHFILKPESILSHRYVVGLDSGPDLYYWGGRHRLRWPCVPKAMGQG